MMNLLTPIQELGFNTQELKPGMIVKFSILGDIKGQEPVRIENCGIIDMIKYDRLAIITNASSGKIISNESDPVCINKKRYKNAFIPFATDDVSDVWSFHDTCNDTVYIVFGIKDAKRLSLKLSFLKEHSFDANTMCHTYYWR